MGTAVAAVPPATNEELVEQYGDYVRKLVRTKGRGVPDQDVDDVVGNILTAVIAANVIGMYDPDHPSKTTFPSFLAGHVLKRLRGQRDKIGRRDTREVLLCDRVADETGTPWVQLHGEAVVDNHGLPEAAETYQRARAYVAAQPVQGSYDPLAVLDVVAAAAVEGKDHLTQVVAAHFGVASTTAGSWLKRVQQAVRDSETAPPPPTFTVAGVELTTRQVREAITILQARPRSTPVIPPLRKAGHPLAAGTPDGWHKTFAAEEQAAYPEIRFAAGTKVKHVDHVKRAVVHRLARLVGDVPASEQLPAQPEPEVQPGLREVLEAELWQLTTDPSAERVDSILAKFGFPAVT